MNTKTILITGCSSGIGYDSAHRMRAVGWRVFAACRKTEDCARLIDEGFESPRIDYADAASINTGLNEVLTATGGTLDVLFNNGAFAIPGALEDLPPEAMRTIFEGNFFGWHDLTRQVIPVMRAQGHGRIVQNSSVLGFAAMPWRGAYNSSKFAVEGYSDTLRLELRGTGIHVVLIEPGPITSAFRANAIKQFETWVDWRASALAERYEQTLLKRLYGSTEPDTFELPASTVSDKLLKAVTVARPRPRYYVTTPTHVIGVLRRVLSTRALDGLLSRI